MLSYCAFVSEDVIARFLGCLWAHMPRTNAFWTLTLISEEPDFAALQSTENARCKKVEALSSLSAAYVCTRLEVALIYVCFSTYIVNLWHRYSTSVTVM